MALFKILKGPEYETVNGQQVSRLPNTYHEGYCYFTTDTHKFYIDISNEQDPSSRVELYTALSEYAVRAYNDENGVSITNNYVKTGSTSSLRANEMLLTDGQKNVTTRKLVEGYNIVSALPAAPDQNVIYLIEDGEDSSSSGGSSSGGNGSNVHYVTLTYSSGVYTIDSSYSQINGWIAAGELVILKYDGIYYYFSTLNYYDAENPFLIFSQVFSTGSAEIVIPSDGAISYQEYSFLTWNDIEMYDGSVEDGGEEPV